MSAKPSGGSASRSKLGYVSAPLKFYPGGDGIFICIARDRNSLLLRAFWCSVLESERWVRAIPLIRLLLRGMLNEAECIRRNKA